VIGKGLILLASLRGAISDWVVVYSQVCVWMDSGTWSPGVLCLQLAAIVVIAVAAKC